MSRGFQMMQSTVSCARAQDPCLQKGSGMMIRICEFVHTSSDLSRSIRADQSARSASQSYNHRRRRSSNHGFARSLSWSSPSVWNMGLGGRLCSSGSAWTTRGHCTRSGFRSDGCDTLGSGWTGAWKPLARNQKCVSRWGSCNKRMTATWHFRLASRENSMSSWSTWLMLAIPSSATG